jgi:hypothetical protein
MADLVPIHNPTTHHQIDIRRISATCGAPGHTDLEVVCSCGFIRKLNHGERSEAAQTILYHRLAAMEAVVGMQIQIEWQPGT